MNDVHPNHPSRGREPADDNQVRTPPHNEDAERSVIGAVLLNNAAYYESASQVLPEHFYRESHRHIWRAMLELEDDDSPVDEVTLIDRLDSTGKLEKAGGTQYIIRLSSYVPSTANASQYVAIVLEKYRLRSLIVAAREAIALAYEGEQKPELIEEKLVEAMRSSKQTSSKRMNAKEIDKELDNQLRDPTSHARTYSTGIQSLDLATGHFVAPGRTTYAAGLSKMGKTSLGIDVFAHLGTKHDFAIDWWSVEMPQTDIETRFISHWSGIPFDDVWDVLQDGQGTLEDLQPEERQKISKAREVFRNMDIEIEFQGRPNIRDIELQTRARYNRLPEYKKRRFALVIDYLQVCTAGGHTRDRYGDLAEVAIRANGLVKDLGCFGLFFVQFDKDADKKFAHRQQRPRFSDIRGLSQAGNDANHQLIIHRPFRDRDNGDERYTEVYHELSRHGKMGNMARLDYDEDLCRFQSWQGAQPTDEQSTGDNSDSWKDHSRYSF